jgi:hypothetical protein
MAEALVVVTTHPPRTAMEVTELQVLAAAAVAAELAMR